MSMTGRYLALSSDELQQVIEQPDSVLGMLFPNDDTTPVGSLDIDKSWHAIHYLLTGTPWEGDPPLCQVVLGGTPIGDDLGYGPARYLTADEVREIAEALPKVTIADLRERYGDGSSLTAAEIYPQIWDRDPSIHDYVLEHFAHLTAFYDRAAKKNQAMLLFLL